VGVTRVVFMQTRQDIHAAEQDSHTPEIELRMVSYRPSYDMAKALATLQAHFHCGKTKAIEFALIHAIAHLYDTYEDDD